MNLSNSNENTNFLTSSRVKKELQKKGYSHLFNWADYKEYKRKCKSAFNQVTAIVDHFINGTDTQSDFNNYIF